MGLDARIGAQFLDAGVGYGGSCFPKDVQALAHMAAVHGCHPQLLRAVHGDQPRRAPRRRAQKLRAALGEPRGRRRSACWGWRSSRTPTTCARRRRSRSSTCSQREGAQVRAYDPAAMEKARRRCCRGVTFVRGRLRGRRAGADAVVLLTEWNEFKQLDLARLRQLMRRPVLVDGRNLYDPREMAALGFIYRGVGRRRSRHWPARRAPPLPTSSAISSMVAPSPTRQIWDPDMSGPYQVGIDAIEPTRIAALAGRWGERFLGARLHARRAGTAASAGFSSLAARLPPRRPSPRRSAPAWGRSPGARSRCCPTSGGARSSSCTVPPPLAPPNWACATGRSALPTWPTSSRSSWQVAGYPRAG